MELFDRAAAAGGQLLRAERIAAGSGIPGAAAEALLLTFDVGRILIRAADGRLAASVVEQREDIPDGTVDASEEEPWWRLLGAPLARGVEAPNGAGLRLEFLTPKGAPRVVVLAADGTRVRAALEPGR